MNDNEKVKTTDHLMPPNGYMLLTNEQYREWDDRWNAVQNERDILTEQLRVAREIMHGLLVEDGDYHCGCGQTYVCFRCRARAALKEKPNA